MLSPSSITIDIYKLYFPDLSPYIYNKEIAVEPELLIL